MDAKPHTPLDELWFNIFKTSRLSELPQYTVWDDMVWAYGRANSPLLQPTAEVPAVPQFRQTVLNAFKLPWKHHITCNHLNILFIWRHDYVAHPRNPSGVISRKIKNEQEILDYAKNLFPQHNVTGYQLDNLHMRTQLELVSESDIIIGMHGAAFGYSLFLPPGGGAIEMFPQEEGMNWHMQYLAKWNNVHYSTWTNTNSTLEDKINKYTTIPTSVIKVLLEAMIDRICNNKFTNR